jgi:DNA helicase-2/ATP-dependent DNA helicase PcrA
MMQVDEIARDIGSRFDYRNRRQTSILWLRSSRWQDVGDDAHSIYSFRVDTVRNILDFPQLFTPAAHIITLDRNYLSTLPILTAANGL